MISCSSQKKRNQGQGRLTKPSFKYREGAAAYSCIDLKWIGWQCWWWWDCGDDGDGTGDCCGTGCEGGNGGRAGGGGGGSGGKGGSGGSGHVLVGVLMVKFLELFPQATEVLFAKLPRQHTRLSHQYEPKNMRNLITSLQLRSPCVLSSFLCALIRSLTSSLLIRCHLVLN